MVYSNALHTNFIMEASTMSPGQTAPIVIGLLYIAQILSGLWLRL